MEFVSKNDNKSILKLYNDKIFLRDKTYQVLKVNLFTNTEGKLETSLYIVKYSRGVLYLYDKSTKEILEEFKLVSASLSHASSKKQENTGTKFYLKQNYYLTLFFKDQQAYILNDKTEELVEKIFNIGKDTVYKTIKGNQLQISTRRNSKWNGCPISILIQNQY
mgnify:CR=1 FL=1